MKALLNLTRKYGLFGLFPLVARKIASHVMIEPSGEFDRIHGLATEDVAFLEDLEIMGDSAEFGVRYEASKVVAFRRAVAKLPVSSADYTFIDLGCGKGRALVLAAMHGFREIVGVEFAPQLCELARLNVDAYQKRSDRAAYFTIHCADAADIDFPDEPSVVYLFNPFGEPIVSAVIERLVRSLTASPRDLFVIYQNPQWRRTTFDRCRHLEVYDASLWPPTGM